MPVEKCIKCGNSPSNFLPICPKCRIELKDFDKLADFLNKYDGDKKELIWLIKDNIADRQSYIIGNSTARINCDSRTIDLDIQSGYTTSKKKIEEIGILYRALRIAQRNYGGLLA